MWFIRGLIILVGIIAMLWLGMQNAGEKVNFSFFTRDFMAIDLNLFMLLVFIAGMVFSFMIAAVNELSLRSQMGRNRRDLRRLERELAALRNMPLEDADTLVREAHLRPEGQVNP